MSTVEDSLRDLDVAIIGGGPAGLATALALHKVNPDLRLKVFEACPEYTPQGAGVGMFTNGVKALQAIDPNATHRLYSSAVYPVMSIDYNDETGERMPWQYPNDFAGALERSGYPPAVVPWNCIRTALYDSLPEGTVVFGCKVTGCSGPGAGEERTHGTAPGGGAPGAEEEGGSRYVIRAVHSASGCGGGPGGDSGLPGVRAVVATARYVIAADGYFSRVRRTVGDGRAPEFQGTVRWLGTVTQADLEAGRVPFPAVLDPQRNPEAMLCFHSFKPTSPDNPCKTLPYRALNLYPVEQTAQQGLRFVWSLYEPVSALEAAGEVFPMPRVEEEACEAAAALQGVDLEQTSAHQTTSRGARALQRALAAASHLPADIRALLAATPPDRVMEFGIYLHPRDSYKQGAWARGGLVLLGDAAHVARPNGQGANLAFEDAAVLGALVRRHGLGPEALRAWEQERLVRVDGVMHEPDRRHLAELLNAASFEPLWCPVALSAPGGPLPEEVAAEVREALATGGVDKGLEVVCGWSRRVIREIVEAKIAGRPQHETIEAPPGTWRG